MKLILQRKIIFFFSLSGSNQRVMVRTCNGLELRDPGFYSDSGDLVDDPSGLFPSASSRDELTPR